MIHVCSGACNQRKFGEVLGVGDAPSLCHRNLLPTSLQLPETTSYTNATMILRPTARPQCLKTLESQQIRHASLLRRPKRPYTFTQLVTLSDGSTFLQRTTSPMPVHRSTKDVRNNPLWNPSSHKLLNIEEDEAGRLARFRERFGRGWDAEATAGKNEEVCFVSPNTCRKMC